MNKINKDWKEVKLGDIVDITMGQSPKSEFYNKRNEGMPFLQGSATFGFMHPYFETYSSDIKKIAINGSVLMSVRAPVGDLNIANADVCIGRGLCSINGKSNIINRYIFYLLSYYKPKLLNMQKGTTFGAITKDDILNFKVLIAEDIEEQKRIASTLSKIDAYLENTIKLIEEKERFKRGIAKKLLTCKEGENIPEARFKGFEDEWETKTLNSISNIKKGEQKNKLDLIADGKYPVLNGGMNFSGYCNSYNREANTITISEGGNAGYVNFIKENFWSSGHCYTLHDLKIDKYFLYQCLKNSEKRLMKLQLGTALKNIRQSEIVEFELNIPKSIKEQEKIGGYLSLLDAEIDNLKKQKELIKEMKKGAMQKLLPGEVRLSKNAFNENI
ncbi:restriction endonuclease subunit S [Brachyspira aalborgi]|mgnify:CR=1 FL=1|jgi:type I restriction enzyme S subunit|uniref:Restriction endonuclease subunit S n=1 Tax=Brachyspira aalborgi TaxID=29522 RepID=A0ABY3KAN7_9SPIR|nr:restriction endonuclease subunit S [Brachyspira aalborgi]TXJ33331.1 restriction endonuclease subunit S [Brachyspira aalborgi]TXJ41331.1 restriction endonuclease subunit S [Brachyspira aalborgi]